MEDQLQNWTILKVDPKISLPSSLALVFYPSPLQQGKVTSIACPSLFSITISYCIKVRKERQRRYSIPLESSK